MSLILQSGMMTNLGRITQVGSLDLANAGIGLNNKGQVAVSVRIDNGPNTVVLLTPTTP